MNLDESYKELHQLDQPAFIEKLNFFGSNFWPLFRFHLLLKFKSHEEYFANTPKKTVTAKKSFLRNFKDKISYRKNLSREWVKLSHVKQNAVLFISDKNYYTDSIDGLAYNRHTDPYYTFLQEAGYPCIKMRVSEYPEDDKKYFHPIDIRFNSFFYFALHRFSYTGDDFIKAQEEIEETCKSAGVQVNTVSFARNVYRIAKSAEMYREILGRIKPRIIFLPCFYEPEKFALVLAAKKLDIPVVDLQHGKQGIKHHIYYGWNYVPDKGYDLLPGYFWNWGIPSARMIEEHFNSSFKPKTIAGGNAWLSLWLNHKIKTSQPLPLQDKNFKKKILVALQPVATHEFLQFIQTLAVQKPGYLLMLRLHPVMQKDKAVFEKLAATYNNIEIELSSSLPLYSLLRYADACVTAWSSVVVEARYFDVPGYLVHENGASIFKEDIEAGKLFYTPGTDGFIDHLENTPVLKEDDFIITDTQHILKNLERICA